MWLIIVCIYLPHLIPSVETKLLFNEATQNVYKISYDEWCTGRRVKRDMIIQHDIGSVREVKSPKYLIRAHQSLYRSDTPNKNNKIAVFDNLDLRKSYVKIEGQRYPRDSSTMKNEENDYTEQNKDFIFFLRNYRRTIIKSSHIISGYENKKLYRNNRFETSTWSYNT